MCAMGGSSDFAIFLFARPAFHQSEFAVGAACTFGNNMHARFNRGRGGAPRRATAEYLVDIISELQRLADASGYRRLTEILNSAHEEARRQRDEVRSPQVR
jgi:hypothetical protein